MTNTSILTLDSVSLALPDGRLLFTDLSETFDQRRTGLVGRNGVGKSLLGQILAGQREPSSGQCRRLGRIHLLDQQVIERSATVADLAQVGAVLAALERIEQGSVAPSDFDTVGERWDIREQLQGHLQRHGLGQLDWHQPAHSLSGGQAMRVALVGAWLSEADYLILDEPSNHLDSNARAQLLSMIEAWDRGLLVISHDRSLLAHMTRIVELSSLGLQAYGGNYSFYSAQKASQTALAQQQLARLKQEQQRQARELQRQREDLERHQARAGRNARHANQAKILVDRQQERSQATAGKQRRDHRDARQALQGKVRDAAREVEQDSAITLHAPTPQRHPGREVLALQALHLPRGTRKPLNLRLCLGQRVGLVGANGSGKSTLLRLINGELPAPPDSLRLSGETALLDQHCSALPGHTSVLDHLRQANPTLAQGDLRSRLAQLGLDAARIELPSGLLSGGERMKAALAAVLYRERPLDLLLLDEPGNHLDLPSLAALEHMLGQFRGALVVASHDQVLLDQLALDEYLHL
ncbi:MULTISPECIES: ATP-binding cassette domain-containing protein [Pseudomonas]|uniref:ATP-binding cassette domain-containing protein n=1 Tax=Pseudomonas asiatica TaxID=2219225 RepID=A0A9X4DF81_9PSED|nr:ATP-binding cassette domain-containing protein [Pseudomonas asiatica]MEE1904303.1 ATP-binding cassette domain-containing protein [Pseudomonas inefficax]MDD2109164.1 ATP-binding cassette domain-containing protein [Pseudomonas asiatica]MDD2115000.1 ATP-binding cassette domain-containing protein [Pseudomonas asiatica]MEE1908097.1 ATP-binding cassette domain-containing protein [Pseudomonas inefficax]MEE1986389.1 ATP-binding cassette domain-containing protein [Pseudomonas inefficax]